MSLVTLRVEGKPKVEQALLGLGQALDTQAILDEGAAVLLHHTLTRFLAEQTPEGEKWPPSKAAMERSARGIGGGTLFDIGKMFRSIQLSSEGPNARAIGTDATSPTGFPYPLVHQYGLAGFPVRTFLGFSAEDVGLMSDVVLNRIKTALKI